MRRWLWLLALLCIGAPAQAHLLNMSRVTVDLMARGEVEVVLALDLTRALGSAEAFHRHSQAPEPLADSVLARLADEAAAAVRLNAGGVAVPFTATALIMPQEPLESFTSTLSWPRAELVLRGRLPAGAEPADNGVRITFLPEFPFEEPIAVTLRELPRADPTASQAPGASLSRWLIAEQRSPALAAATWLAGAADGSEATSLWAVVGHYLVLGVRHIVPAGWDHLLFVAGLALGARRPAALAGLLSIYTVAHSLTLALVALGWVRTPGPWVETAIALSLVWVALENLRTERARATRFALTFAFGLLHGMGFAGALRETGLPADGLLAALFGFNLGVEVGQLGFAGLLLIAVLPSRGLHYRRRVLRPASIGIAAAGAGWAGVTML